MKLSLNWLRELTDVPWPVPELASRLIDATAEVESWETIGAQWDPEKVRVAEVVAIEPHPNADRLRLATVETGQGQQQVVCGAPNLAVGLKVAFATEGQVRVTKPSYDAAPREAGVAGGGAVAAKLIENLAAATFALPAASRAAPATTSTSTTAGADAGMTVRSNCEPLPLAAATVPPATETPAGEKPSTGSENWIWIGIGVAVVGFGADEDTSTVGFAVSLRTVRVDVCVTPDGALALIAE